eukprot:13678022-Alexandrium_andersonii.AAC.1
MCPPGERAASSKTLPGRSLAGSIARANEGLDWFKAASGDPKFNTLRAALAFSGEPPGLARPAWSRSTSVSVLRQHRRPG